MGFDVSAVEFVWSFRSEANAGADKRYVPDTPSATSYQKMTLDQLGNLTTTGTITSSAGELSPGDITSVSLTGDSGSILNDTSGAADFVIAGGTNCSTVGGASQTMTINVDTPAVTAINNATANELVTIGATTTQLDAEANLTFDGTDLSIASTGKLILGAGDTYIQESNGDVLDIKVGDDLIFQITESGADGNTINIDNACIGFTQIEPVYDATTTIVDFRHSNKQFVTFGAGNNNQSFIILSISIR
jgi:hypothetical protein